MTAMFLTHGLTHARTLELTLDGRGLAGEDMLLAMEDADKRRFDAALDARQAEGHPASTSAFICTRTSTRRWIWAARRSRWR